MTNKIDNNQLLHDVTRYWNIRAESYSAANQQELLSEKQQKWRQLLLSHVKEGETLNVLDIGTGPGFFAILLALSGHQVTAIDATSGMLLEAKNNASQHHVSINFVCGDVQDLPFGDEQFDLVVSRNVTWNLKSPSEAYQEWFRVLKPGGSLINFDANWYYICLMMNIGKVFLLIESERRKSKLLITMLILIRKRWKELLANYH